MTAPAGIRERRPGDGPGAGRLRIQGLGPLRVWLDDEEIDIGPPKQAAAFAVLALCAGATISRGELVDRVWGGSAPATAAGSLHTYVSGLRRALGPQRDLLTGSRTGYALQVGPDVFDVAHAEDLAARARAARGTAQAAQAYEHALAQWTAGSLLAGVPGPFVALARDRLAGLRRQLLVEHAEIADAGVLPEVADRLLGEIPAQPFDERLRTAALSALHRVGRTAEALAQYEDLRRVLASELGISPSPATQHAYTAILAADSRPAEEPPADTPIRPAQLPPDNDDFVGRSAELQAVVDSAVGGAHPRRVVMIVGEGGIGKTTLAVRGAHLLRDGYPDGQIYLDLHGFDPSSAALTPDAALHQLLGCLGVRHVPAGRAERVALWRSMLADRRVLVVLDNARSVEQVEELLPGGSGCFVIVTSRHRLPGLAIRRAARRIRLAALSEEEALLLFAAVVGADRVRAEPEAARRLAALCDHSPLALQIAAEQLGSTGGARVGDLVDELQLVSRRLDILQVADDPRCSIRGVLSWSLAALGEDAVGALTLFGVLSGASVDRRTAAALLGVAVHRAEDLLDELCALHLLRRDGDRFTMTGLTRVYAAELSGALDTGERRDVRASRPVRVARSAPLRSGCGHRVW